MRSIPGCVGSDLTMKLPNRRGPVLVSLCGLILAMLACTSNDTLFIHLTETPIPTLTSTPLAIETRFKVNETVTIVSGTFQITMSSRPVAPSAASAANAPCFPKTRVTIKAVSGNEQDPTDPTIYYDIQCGTADGWVPEYWLTPLKPDGSAVVKSPDGKGAVIYSDSDMTSQAAGAPCPDGTQVSILDMTMNVNAVGSTPDNHIYVQVTCGDTTGYVLENDLVPTGS
jgi:hypothetical protein